MQGGTTILLPALEISFIHSPEMQVILQTIHEYDGVIFLSQNAVKSFAPFMTSHANANQRIIAIGAATAKCLTSYQIKTVDMPLKYDSEHLLMLLKREPLAGKKFLILSGEGGRNYLENELKIAGAKVTKLAVYRRKKAFGDALFLHQVASIKNSVTIVTSCEGFDALFEMSKRHLVDSWLTREFILVISERIKNFILEKGWSSNQIIMAENGADQTILAQLIKWYAIDKAQTITPSA